MYKGERLVRVAGDGVRTCADPYRGRDPVVPGIEKGAGNGAGKRVSLFAWGW